MPIAECCLLDFQRSHQQTSVGWLKSNQSSTISAAANQLRISAMANRLLLSANGQWLMAGFQSSVFMVMALIFLAKCQWLSANGRFPANGQWLVAGFLIAECRLMSACASSVSKPGSSVRPRTIFSLGNSAATEYQSEDLTPLEARRSLVD
jgi:hypothetical protein